MQPSDEKLIQDTLEGDHESFTILVQRYQGRLVNYLFRMLRNLDDAHDLAQEVFLKIHKALDRYNPKYRFSTWLFRVGQNAAIDSIRKRRLKVVSMHGRPGPDGESTEWEFPTKDPDAYRELRNLERGDAIREAVDGLPEEYRELIVLRHYGELTYDEIAQLKEMPLGTVKNKLFRGRKMLQAKLASYLKD
jgi:RNA polymerase sigma-70 factor (ECF subfamily)